MNRRLILLGGVIIGVGLLGYAGWRHLKFVQTKSFSPETRISFNPGDLHVSVFYNRPYMKGRTIFDYQNDKGSVLVPYDSVWRTGANEATIFETNRAISFKGKILPAGAYSMWTIPGKDLWVVIFNSETGQWGINSEGEPNRDPKLDVLEIEVPPVVQPKEFEQFTIIFEEVGNDAEMSLMWDKTIVAVPFSY